jgi:hypothetical protein
MIQVRHKDTRSRYGRTETQVFSEHMFSCVRLRFADSKRAGFVKNARIEQSWPRFWHVGPFVGSRIPTWRLA